MRGCIPQSHCIPWDTIVLNCQWAETTEGTVVFCPRNRHTFSSKDLPCHRNKALCHIGAWRTWLIFNLWKPKVYVWYSQWAQQPMCSWSWFLLNGMAHSPGIVPMAVYLCSQLCLRLIMEAVPSQPQRKRKDTTGFVINLLSAIYSCIVWWVL